MGIVELSFLIVLLTFSSLFSLLVYFGMTPNREIRSLVASLVGSMWLHPAVTIAVLLVFILGNLLIISFRASFSPPLLTAAMILSILLSIAVLANLVMRLTIRREIPSVHTNLLLVMASEVQSVSNLPNPIRIATSTLGPSLQWLQTALQTYDMSFTPVIVAETDLFEAFQRGIIDTALITEHASIFLDEAIALGKVRFLPWSLDAVVAVTKAFPTVTRAAVLPPNTYAEQTKAIRGYASN